MKYTLFLPIVAAFTVHALAEAPTPQTDFRKTLTAAGKDNKMAFILLGRPTCGNCNATKAMVSSGQIPVTSDTYVMGDLNIDDPKTEGEFMRKYGKEKFGETLPFVVVTDAHGKLLASSGGMKQAAQWTTILNEAKAKAGAKAATADTGTAGAGNANWPFKTPAKP